MTDLDAIPVDLSGVTSWPQAIVAIVIGIVILAGMIFVNDFLHRRVVRSKMDEVRDDIKQEIKTNHGSTSTGNAIDRQTEALARIEARQLLSDQMTAQRFDQLERRMDGYEDTLGT